MVLLGRIELPASSLPMTRSTTELQQPFAKTCYKGEGDATIKKSGCHPRYAAFTQKMVQPIEMNYAPQDEPQDAVRPDGPQPGLRGYNAR